MGKKVQKPAQKQSKKKEQANKADQSVQQPKQRGRKSKAEQKDAPSGLQSFRDTIQRSYQGFNSLYTEINREIESSGKTNTFDLSQKNSQLSQKIRNVCQDIFRDEVKQAQQWIQQQQTNIKTQINSLQSSFDKVRTILVQTNAFKQSEVTTTLALLQAKVDEKRSQLALYENLLQKSKSVYS